MNRRISLFLGATVLLTTLFVAMACWLWGRAFLHRWLEEETRRVQGYVLQTVATRQRLLELADTELTRNLRENLPKAAAELGPDPIHTATGETLRQLARKHGMSDLYVVDADGVVVASSLPGDVGLDLASQSEQLRSFLASIRGTGTLGTHAISLGSREGLYRKYGYFGPRGADYLVEASYNLEEYLGEHYSPATRNLLLFRDFPLVPGDCHFVSAVDLFALGDGMNWSLTRRGDRLLLTAAQRDQLERDGLLDVADGDGVRYVLLGGHYPSEAGVGQFREHRVARIRLDRSRLDQELHTLLLSVVLSALLIGMVAILIVTEYVDRRYLSRLAVLNDAMIRIAEGDYNVSDAAIGLDELGTAVGHVRIAAERISQRERAFQRLTNNLNVTLESMGETVIATDDEGRISRMNPAAEALTGWTALEASGRRIAEVFQLSGADPGSLDALMERSRQVARPVSLPAQATVVSRCGTTHGVAGSVAVIRLNQGNVLGFVLVCSDTTEQTRQDRRLHEFETRFRAIMDHAPIAMALMTADGTPIFANGCFCRLVGGATADIQRQGIEGATHPEDAARTRQECQRLLSGEAELTEFATRYLHPDGQLVHAHVTMVAIREPGKPPCLLLLGRDVTDEERISRELRWEREQRRLILDHTHEYLFHLSLDLRVLWANRAADPEGRAAREPTRCHHLICGTDEPCQGCPVQTAVATGESAESTVDIGGRHLMVTANPLYDHDRRIEGVVVSARDVTRMHEVERQLFQAQKLDALGRLAGGIAHDFSNMLNVVIGYADLLGIEDDESLRTEYLSTIVHAARSAEGLVRQLLAFSRTTGEVQREKLDLNLLTQAFAKMLGGILGANLDLQTQLHASPLVARVDAGQFEQALMNLCINARDAMPSGGRLTIRTLPVHRDGTPGSTHGTPRSGRFAACEISDTGTGIPERLLSRIFDPFFTTKTPGDGTGLGLATTYAIVTDHDGLIEVDSTLGQGTTFRILLPLLDQASETAVVPKAAPEDEFAARPGEAILAVEDDDRLRPLLQGFLERAGYRVVMAETGTEAILLFDQHRAELSLALLDVMLPGCSGIQVARHIASTCPRLPVLFSSGCSTDTPGFAEIAGCLITKPFDRLDLLRRIRAALDGVADGD